MTVSRRAGLVVLIALWLVSTLVSLTPGMIRPDGAAYLSWLPTTYLDGDLLLYDQWQQLGMVRNGRIYFKEITDTEHLANHWTIGSAIWWAPAFIGGDVARSVIPALQRFSRNGMNLPYNVAVATASAIAGLFALLISYNVASRLTTPGSAAFSAVLVWFGSPLLFYSLKNSLMSHAVVAGATALVVALALRSRDESSPRLAFLFGLTAGFAFIVRPQNLPFVLLPLILSSRESRPWIWRRTPLALAGFVVGALPQLVVSHFVYGSFAGFLGVGGDDPGRPWRAFERVWLWEPIFSWYHGLVPWTPLLALCIVGWAFVWRRDRRLAMAAVAMFGVQWLINATMERSFWGAFAFGQRRFDNCTIFFVVGLAALLAERRWRGVTVSLAVASTVWTLLLSVAATSVLDLNRYYTPGELVIAVASVARVQVGLLVNVPEKMRMTILLVMVVGAVWSLLAALSIWMLGRHQRLWALLPAAFVGLSALVAWCGVRDAARLESFRTVIEHNRALGLRSGGSDTRLALLEYEYDYLERSGRNSEAARTLSDLNALRALRAKESEE